MNEMGPRRIPRDQSSGSGYTMGTSRHPHPNLIDPIPTKRICFYKSGDPQFSGLRMVINSRTFKSFDALLDSLSKKVPLPFGVRNITTPRGVHAVHTLDELEDGKSYICSDSRKVKPINMAKASRKLAPWYHARPVSPRRRTTTTTTAVRPARRQRPDRATTLRQRHRRNKQEPGTAVRTPKRLTVFRNGDPTAKHTVILQRRTTPTFEALLDYVSQMMQFHVVKMYTPDGRRVDGLPALILCSGTVVAAGREPFRASNYNAEKSPAPTWLPTNQIGPRRIRPMLRKKKSMRNTSKSRLFSPSSERHFLNQIRNSITGSSCDFPSNATGSVELETCGHVLESVAETEGEEPRFEDGGTEGQEEGCPPLDDDIEKSFRVNQDGSMTVEMRVRLTVKEEETVHWTTTLTRSSVANQLTINSLPEPETIQTKEEERISTESNQLASQMASTEEPLSLENRVPSEDENQEDKTEVQTDASSPRRVATPGPWGFRQERTSVESVKSVTPEGVQEDTVGSYSYMEQTQNGELTEQYCVVKQSSTRPVPKPRRFNSVDGKQESTFKSAGMTEILQVQNGREEVTETVLHIYEQQVCQDNYLANSHFCAQGMSMAGFLCGRPATSDAAQCSSGNNFETELGRPSTASESIGIWRADNVSPTFNFPLPPESTGVDCTLPMKDSGQKQVFPKPVKGGASFKFRSQTSKENSQQRVANKAKKMSPKPKGIMKQVRRIASPGKRAKQNKADELEINRKVKPFSSAGFLKGIYGHKTKNDKSADKNKHSIPKHEDNRVHTKSLESTSTGGDTLKHTIKEQNILSPVEVKKGEAMSFEKNMLSPTEQSPSRGKLERQTSMHRERKNDSDISECMSLPAFNSSSSVINEYVEHWLEKAHPDPTVYPLEETHPTHKTRTEIGTSNEPETYCDMINAKAKETLETIPSPDGLLISNVKQRIQSFENKQLLSSQTPDETTSLTQQINADSTVYNCLPTSNDNSLKTKSSSPETPTKALSDGQLENKSTPEESSVQKTTVESPVEKPELSNTDPGVIEASSKPSTPLYLESSLSSLSSEDVRPVSISPTSDPQPSPPDCTLGKTPSPPTMTESPLSRNPSVRKARLVSNLSFERKMSLRKASLEKSALTGDAALEASASAPVEIAIEHTMTSNCPVLNSAQQTRKDMLEKTTSNGVLDLAITANSPSFCVSASPTSLISDPRASSASLSSDEEDPTPTNHPLTETKSMSSQLPLQKVSSSPKLLTKKGKMENNSKASTDKSDLPNDLIIKKKQASRSPSLERAPLTRNTSVASKDKSMSPSLGTKKMAIPKSSPSTEKRLLPSKDLLQKTRSPYSQSLEVLSPKPKSKKKLLSRNTSLDNASEQKHLTLKRSASLQKPIEPQLDKSSSMPLNILKDENYQTTTNEEKAIQEKFIVETQVMPQPLNLAKQPNIEPVLEKLCYSIKSIRQITQNNRPSCLEKSNSLPDFSGHVASTFGSSTKALLAFLSVMTLKEGISNLNMNTTLKMNANDVSCAEALKMIDSLKELANIEDAQELKTSLADLQKSTSTQLLQSWKGFKQLSEEYKSRTPTPNNSEHERSSASSPVDNCNADENVIDEIISELDIPDELKKELAAMPESDDEGKMATKIIEEAVNDSELDQNEEQNSQDSFVQDEVHADQTTIEREYEHEEEETSEAKYHEAPTDLKDKPTSEEVVNDSELDQNEEQNSQDSFIQNEVHADQTNIEKEYEHEEEETSEAKYHEAPTDLKDKPTSEEEVVNDSELDQNEGQNSQDSFIQNEVHADQTNIEREREHEEKETSEAKYHKAPTDLKDKPKSEEEQALAWSNGSPDDKDIRAKVKDVQSPSEDSEEELKPRETTEINGWKSAKESSEESLERGRSGAEDVSNSSIKEQCSSELEVEDDSKDNEDDSSIREEQHDTQHGAEDVQGSEREKKTRINNCMGLSVSSEESGCSLDVGGRTTSEGEETDDTFQVPQLSKKDASPRKERHVMQASASDEDELHFEHKELNVIIEESLSEAEQDREQEHHADCLGHADTHNCVEPTSQRKSEVLGRNRMQNRNIIENNNLINQSTSKMYSDFDVDVDSGNDPGEHTEEVEHNKAEDEQCISSLEQLSYEDKESSSEDKESSSEEEHSSLDQYKEEDHAAHLESRSRASQSKDNRKSETLGDEPKCNSEEKLQSVAERIKGLERQVADSSQQKTATRVSKVSRHSLKREASVISDVEPLMETVAPAQTVLCTGAALQSSLSFSYDCDGVITREPEVRSVQSIKEMFMAKSVGDIQYGQRRFPSPNTSELSDYRTETSDSGGYRSQSSELSSGDDDSSRKSIAKGLVRRTIERLYGKKDTHTDVADAERPSSAQTQKKNTQSIFSKVMSDLSYLSSTTTLGSLGEAPRCVTLHAGQVGPADILIDEEKWLSRENTVIRKSISEPVSINKGFDKPPEDEEAYDNTKEKDSYSLFDTKSDSEDKDKSKCIYFTLRHTSDSDIQVSPDDQSSTYGESVSQSKEEPAETGSWAERNGSLPLAEFKMPDNKVHPLVEGPPDGQVIAKQPGKGHAVVNRRPQDPDMLDVLYNFCGQNCPIL